MQHRKALNSKGMNMISEFLQAAVDARFYFGKNKYFIEIDACEK